MYSAGFRGGALHPIDLRGEDTGRTRERERDTLSSDDVRREARGGVLKRAPSNKRAI